MLVLSKLTNINHANGGSYDPPLFLYSALFAARGRFGGASPPGGGFGGASPHGGGLWRGFPARRRLWRGFPARRRALAGLPRAAAGFGGASPHGGLWLGFPARRRALAGFPARRRALAGFPARRRFGGASPHGFLCRRGTFGLGRAVFSLFFAYAPGIRQKHPQKFCRLHCRISYCIGKFKKFVKINE